MTKYIPLTQGQIALVDDADYDELAKHRWHAFKHRNTYYAMRKIHINKKTFSVYMHAQITGYKMTDHINSRGWDNRRKNLRECTQSENTRHRKIQRNNTSGYKGVTKIKNSNMFLAHIGFNNVKKVIGRFHNAIDAAKAYDEWARKLHGDFALCNFNK